jgi:hypothetical protein
LQFGILAWLSRVSAAQSPRPAFMHDLRFGRFERIPVNVCKCLRYVAYAVGFARDGSCGGESHYRRPNHG